MLLNMASSPADFDSLFQGGKYNHGFIMDETPFPVNQRSRYEGDYSWKNVAVNILSSDVRKDENRYNQVASNKVTNHQPVKIRETVPDQVTTRSNSTEGTSPVSTAKWNILVDKLVGPKFLQGKMLHPNKNRTIDSFVEKVPEKWRDVADRVFRKETPPIQHKRTSEIVATSKLSVSNTSNIQRQKRERKKSVYVVTEIATQNWRIGLPPGVLCYDNNELAEDQRCELQKAFLLFVKAGKNKMAAKDLGGLLRCLGWNPSEPELEEARHELDVSARGSITFEEVEKYVARRGGICNGCGDEADVLEAFQMLGSYDGGRISVEKFRHFMTTMGDKMSEEEVDEIIKSMKKDEGFIEFRDLIDAKRALLEDR